MLSTLKIEEGSQNCFIFDVVKFKKSDNQEVLQNCCVFDVVKFKKLRKSRTIASFSSLQIDR